MSVREETESWERDNLSEYASLSSGTLGRDVYEEPCQVRTEFQKDRDRIIHSLYFRLLKHKTQVYLSTTGEEFRTRLTHTLEVSTVARYISRALGLNTDLAEAAALGHDLGHTPFGHMGEDTLKQITPFAFSHSNQSLRVVEKLENGGRGLNLTREVRDAISGHAKGKKSIFEVMNENSASGGESGTIEGEVVQFADWIAYINHDVDDAFNMGLIGAGDLPGETGPVLGYNFQQRLVSMTGDVIEASRGREHILMSEEVMNATEELRSFLYSRVYELPQIAAREKTARTIVAVLYEYYCENYSRVLEQMPFLKDEDPARGACDFIASLTDPGAQELYRKITGNEP